MNPRVRMVEEIKEKYNFDSPKVFSVMLSVPREKFVPSEFQKEAYADRAISIGFGQTISQPYTVAFMTDLLELSGREKVLEIGTGSGYQAAILSLLTKEVFTVERIPKLAETAAARLKKLGYKNVSVRVRSGEYGLKEAAPFDAILVTAGIKDGISEALISQLNTGGIMVAPVGEGEDKVMTKYTKLEKGKIKKQEYGVFNFVPFVED